MDLQHRGEGRDIPPLEIRPSPQKSDTVDSGGNGGVEASRSDGPTVEKTEDLLIEPPRYKISDRQYKGIFALFSHETFINPKVGKRDGNSADVKKIEEVWTKLGFKVEIHKDLCLDAIKDKIKTYAKNDYQKSYDAFFCAVLTHGEKDEESKKDVLYACDETYSVEELTNPFQSCESLARKPKVFFIQACRGIICDEGLDAPDAGKIESDSRSNAGEEITVKVPKEADFLIAYATPPGYYAWRNCDLGSWFIQALSQCLEKYASKWDLMTILTQVNREVGLRQSMTNVRESSGKKQCPSIVSRLTALLYLLPTEAYRSVSQPVAEKTLEHPQYESKWGIDEGDKVEDDEKEDQRVYMKMKQDLMRKKMEVLALKQQVYEMKLKSKPVKFEV